MDKTRNSRENQWFHENERHLLEDAIREREKHIEASLRESEKDEHDRWPK